MKLRFYALIASTMLAGCVFTDDTNQTGGDFLDAHGASMGPATSQTLAVPVLSVEEIPTEGVPGTHGTEDAVLGSLGKDSIRLTLAFNFADSTLRNSYSLQKEDTLTRLLLVPAFPKEGVPAMTVRARFLWVSDTNCLPGLLAGVEPGVMEADAMRDTLISDIDLAVQSDTTGSTVVLSLPDAVKSQIVGKLQRLDPIRRSNPSILPQSWLVVLLDARTATSGRVRFSTGSITLQGRDTAATNGVVDTSGVMNLGAMGGNLTYRSVGFRPQGAPMTLGWWPTAGHRIRVGLDAQKLRRDMWAKFGIQHPDTVGGFDNTFNILQARITARFASVKTENAIARTMLISSTVINDSGELAPITSSGPVSIPVNSDMMRIAGFTVQPQLTFTKLPGGYMMNVNVENKTLNPPTRLTVGEGSYTASAQDAFLPYSESVEFTIKTFVRVRVKVEKSKVTVKYQLLDWYPTYDGQDSVYGSWRTNAQLQNGTNFVTQEIRNPLTQVLNRWKRVEVDMTPSVYVINSTADNSLRVLAELPQNPLNVFDSVQVVARPLIGRKN